MDVRGKRVLILGDSLTHRGSDTGPVGVDVTEGTDRSSTPGDLLASYLLALGAKSARINGRVSRSAWNFFRVEDGVGILRVEASRQPDVVFVFLGTNDLGLDPALDAQAFARIRDGLAPAEIWAIGPPSFADTGKTTSEVTVYRTLAQVFSAGRVIDIRSLTPDLARTQDGVHFPASSARILAGRIAHVIAEVGAPIVLHAIWKPIAASLGLGSFFVGLATWFRRRRRRQARAKA